MQRFITMCACALVLAAGLIPLAQASVPLLITHQGRLLDASDHPVSGAVTLTFRLYDAPSGGALLWTEAHTGVVVTNGLFDVSLGSLTPLTSDMMAPPSSGSGGEVPPRYLEVQVSSDAPLLPRMRLGTVPYAVASGRVTGDMETAPGEMRLLGGMSGSTTGTIRMMASPDSVQDLLYMDSDNDGHADNGVESKITPTTANHAINTKGTGSAGRVVASSSSANGSSASLGIDRLNKDAQSLFVVEQDVTLYTDADSAGMAVRNQCCPGHVTLRSGMSGSTTGTIRMATSLDSTGEVVDHDSDGDGHAESHFTITARDQYGNCQLATDTDDDGVADNDVDFTSDATGARSALEHRSGSTTGTIRMSASGGGPILPSTEMAQKMDLNGNGTAEKYYVVGCSHDRVSALLASDDDDDGVADHDLELSSDATGSVARLGGRSGSTTGTIRMMANPDSAVAVHELDSDNDGKAEQQEIIRINPNDSWDLLLSDTDDDGVANYSVESHCDASSSSLALHGDLAVGKGSLEFIVGNEAPEVSMSDASGVRMRIRPDSGLQLYDALGAKGCVLGSDGKLQVAGRIIVGEVSAPTHKIDVEGGAYCDGTDWVNGSDVASKENFTAVDGGELLIRIANLKITRWNYKGQPEVEHIGPMAQDFQAAFGVGANDKTISTIDPSGIALAAIKELQQQNKLLREALEKLNRKVEELSSSR